MSVVGLVVMVATMLTSIVVIGRDMLRWRRRRQLRAAWARLSADEREAILRRAEEIRAAESRPG